MGLASVGVDGSKDRVAIDLNFAGTLWDPVGMREEAVQRMGDVLRKIMRLSWKTHLAKISARISVTNGNFNLFLKNFVPCVP